MPDICSHILTFAQDSYNFSESSATPTAQGAEQADEAGIQRCAPACGTTQSAHPEFQKHCSFNGLDNFPRFSR